MIRDAIPYVICPYSKDYPRVPGATVHKLFMVVKEKRKTILCLKVYKQGPVIYIDHDLYETYKELLANQKTFEFAQIKTRFSTDS